MWSHFDTNTYLTIREDENDDYHEAEYSKYRAVKVMLPRIHWRLSSLERHKTTPQLFSSSIVSSARQCGSRPTPQSIYMNAISRKNKGYNPTIFDVTNKPLHAFVFISSPTPPNPLPPPHLHPYTTHHAHPSNGDKPPSRQTAPQHKTSTNGPHTPSRHTQYDHSH